MVLETSGHPQMGPLAGFSLMHSWISGRNITKSNSCVERQRYTYAWLPVCGMGLSNSGCCSGCPEVQDTSLQQQRTGPTRCRGAPAEFCGEACSGLRVCLSLEALLLSGQELSSVLLFYFCSWISFKSWQFCSRGLGFEWMGFTMFCALPSFSACVKWQHRKWYTGLVFLYLYIKFKKFQPFGLLVCPLAKKKWLSRAC